MAEYHNQSKLRFWCQMVLPLVYDDSLSYMELLNKVVSYLNNCIQDVGNCETNIESLLEAFVNLQDYVNEITEDVSPLIEEKIDEMIESGEFGEILADALATVVAPEYDSSKSYVPLNYAIKDGQLYCCTANTTGEWDSTKWRETTVGDELNTLMQRVFALNAGQVSFDESATYSSGTVGNKLKNLSANDIAYNASETYNDATVGKELSNLNGAISQLDSDDIANASQVVGGAKVTNALETLNGAITSVEKGLAIIVTGDTCTTAVPSGGYAYIKNNTHGLTEGLYRNKTASAFPTSGGTANSTIFEAVSNGGLNELLNKVTTKNEIKVYTHTYTGITGAPGANIYLTTDLMADIADPQLTNQGQLMSVTNMATSGFNGALFITQLFYNQIYIVANQALSNGSLTVRVAYKV